MNLEQFLASLTVRNSYVKHPDFRELYVRKGSLIVCLEKVPDHLLLQKEQLMKEGRVTVHGGLLVRLERSVTLARIIARKTGQGDFTRLVESLVSDYDVPVHVECVLEPRFAAHLERRGWDRLTGSEGSPSFVTNWKQSLSSGKQFSPRSFTGTGLLYLYPQIFPRDRVTPSIR